MARVRFTGWTNEKHACATPVFLAIREDAQPADCRWENEVAADDPPPAALVHATETQGRVLAQHAQIEAELFTGKQENISIELDGKRLRLTHLNKVYFPEPGIYQARSSRLLLPRRGSGSALPQGPPAGAAALPRWRARPGLLPGYLREGLPGWLETVPIDSESKGQPIHYAIANDRAALLYLTGLGCIDHNPWSS